LFVYVGNCSVHNSKFKEGKGRGERLRFQVYFER
jgi:hypothetical protein